MDPLFSQSEFDQAGGDQLLPLRCRHCGECFHRSKHQIQKALVLGSRDKKDFCNRGCGSQYRYRGHRIDVACTQCGSMQSRSVGRVSKSKNHFCSQTCATTWNNQHKTTGTRRSKLEVWLESQLSSLYPGLEFHFNRTDAIEAELDIYVPSLKLAFELNGIFHYEPIYGADKLERIHKNDHRKVLACAEHGIGLCVIDSSSMLNFKEKKAERFLGIVQGLVDRAIIDEGEK